MRKEARRMKGRKLRYKERNDENERRERKISSEGVKDRQEGREVQRKTKSKRRKERG